ncbi:MAG: cytochrome c3 family protein [Halofilum sp. (in: g-proteobacteria)]|nr:cytochrome c3 family protein [Halofilum sp. (in: g-proteobacteria)]
MRGPGAGGGPGGSGQLGAIPWHLAGGDQLWDSGEMSRPHRFFGRQCSQCHRRPFQRVTDAACLDCHEGQAHHADDAGLMRTSGLSGTRCASCHREHSGLEAMIGTDPRLCTDCHAEPGETMAGAEVEPVWGFLGESHPRFRVRLVSMPEAGEPEWKRVRMTGAVSEDNGLVFPHDVHLADEGVTGPGGGKEQLACADCHQPGADGAAMQPVRFERDCQGCHRLDFAAGDPDRELPHGEPAAVLAVLEEYYARVALRGGYTREEAEPPEVVRRKRPGGERLGEDERQAALEWSQQWARTVAGEVFEYRTCKTCHEVSRQPETEAGWAIAPVAMTQDWFPAHRFDHEPHMKTACTECHDAAGSGRTQDVLMPAIDTCRQCHGDSDSTARVASRCVDCHDFHTARELEMGGGALHADAME